MNREILIVEDDPIFRDAIKHVFEDKSYTFYEASTVAEANAALNEYLGSGVVLLDLKLPDGSGTLVLETIKNSNLRRRVIVLTAHEEMLAAKMAGEYAVFSYQPKAKSLAEQALIFAVEQAFTVLEKENYQTKIDMDAKILERINANGDLSDALDLICQSALEYIGGYTCHVRLSDLNQGDLVLQACRGPFKNLQKIFNKRRKIDEFYSGYVAKTKKPETFDDLQEHGPFLELKKKILANRPVDEEVRTYLNNVRSAYITPIFTGVAGAEVDAVLNVSSTQPNFFSKKEPCTVIDGFASHAANAIAKHWHKSRKAEVHEDYRGLSHMLIDVTEALKRSEMLKLKDNLDPIYEIVTRKISEILHPEIISIFRFNKQTQLLEKKAEFRAKGGYVSSTEIHQPKDDLTGLVFSSAKPVRLSLSQLPDLKQGEGRPLALRYEQEQRALSDIPSGELEHYLGVPIQVGKQVKDVVGVIRTVNKLSQDCGQVESNGGDLFVLPRGFSEDCETELEIAASLLSVAIQNAELVSQFQTINELGRKISSVGIDHLLEKIVTLTAEFINADICLLFIKNERGDKLLFSKSYGIPGDRLKDAYYRIGEDSKTGKVAETGISILEEEADRHHQGKYDAAILKALREEYGDESKDIDSFMAVPVFGKEPNPPLGVIKVINKRQGRAPDGQNGPKLQFNQEDLRLLEIFAGQIGLVRFAESQWYRKLIRNSPEPIIVLDDRGKVKIFSKACESLWGYRADEVIEESVLALRLYESEEEARRIGRLLEQHPDHAIENEEAQIRSTTGEIIPISLSATWLFDEEGAKTGSVGVFKDQREFKRLQEQKLINEKLDVIDMLAKTVVHDVRHDLGTALNYTSALLNTEKDTEKNEELVNTYRDILEALWSAAAQLEDVLLAGKPKPPFVQTVLLTDVLNLASGPMSRRAIRSDINLHIRQPVDRRVVKVDIDQMRRVLWNLFNNSVHAIRKRRDSGNLERGRIELASNIRDDYVELLWQDNGCGIAENVVSQVFTPFFTTRKTGSGLGLSLVRTVIESHGGTVSVESEPDQWTRFTIRLQAEKD
jgi:PAS domain S-box-containing protein